MAIKTKAQLKQYFETGKRPTQSQFSDLIDSLVLLSEMPEVPLKTYKVFSALLRIDDVSVDYHNPDYLVRYKLLEPNTIGDLNIYLTRGKIRIESDLSMLGLLPFERRFLTLGNLRADYNFDSIIESDDINDVYIDLIFNMKLDYGDGTSVPVPASGPPLFYNLPIEIRIYNEIINTIEPPIDSLPIDL